jgi:large subunit ribosomal protein L4
VQATVYNLAGEEVEKIELDDSVFGITPNMAVVNQAVLRQQANARQGTHDTRTRAEVRGGGRKPWRQKGTGRARQGSTRAPQWRHGGVVFGPHPRSYEQDMPRKMRRLAIRSVLSAKAADGQVVLVDSFEELEPRTKAMIEAMKSLNIGENSALIMVSERTENLAMAASNLPKVKTMSAHLLSVVDMLKHDYLVMPRASLDVIYSILGGSGGRRKLPLQGFSAEVSANGAAGTEEAEEVEEVEEVEEIEAAASVEEPVASVEEAEEVEAADPEETAEVEEVGAEDAAADEDAAPAKKTGARAKKASGATKKEGKA